MRTTGFSFESSESLIAHYPMPERSSCRLLSLDGPTDVLTHGTFTDLFDKFNPGDPLAFNNIHVIPARLSGRKTSGGKTEVPVEWMLDDKHILAHIHVSKVSKPNAKLLLDDDESINATMTARHNAPFEVGFNDQRLMLDILNSIGHIPLPPYIDRPDGDVDRKLYQTIYSEKPDTVAALTAGLYFDEPLLEKLRAKGVEMAFVTLHVGVGIFQLVCVDTIEDHTIHSGYAEISQDMVDTVLVAKACGSRVIVVGTTPIRSLKNAAQAAKSNLIEPLFNNTQIFIYPSFQCKAVDALVTSSHLPESTLIMLASVFAGYQYTMNIYRAAAEEKYRFFGYDDAMFTTYSPQAINERVGE